MSSGSAAAITSSGIRTFPMRSRYLFTETGRSSAGRFQASSEPRGSAETSLCNSSARERRGPGPCIVRNHALPRSSSGHGQSSHRSRSTPWSSANRHIAGPSESRAIDDVAHPEADSASGPEGQAPSRVAATLRHSELFLPMPTRRHVAHFRRFVADHATTPRSRCRRCSLVAARQQGAAAVPHSPRVDIRPHARYARVDPSRLPATDGQRCAGGEHSFPRRGAC